MQYEEFQPLRKSALAADPVAQFAAWFDEANASSMLLPEGVVLATAGAGGSPSLRTVLLKGFDASGFTFFTNYLSRKGRELERDPRASLLFWWRELGRQVRIDGTTTRVSEAESDAYFATRPRSSQIAAWVSEQSSVIASRELLEERRREVESRFSSGAAERPPHWGGYRLTPHEFEFWQGQPDRLHDRFRYRLGSGVWTIERLAP
jgi:pyridoxamine 5'-phosphate oxidase